MNQAQGTATVIISSIVGIFSLPAALEHRAQAEPTAERATPTTIEIDGADFAQVIPSGEVIEGVPFNGDSAWGSHIIIQIDPYKDYEIHTWTLPPDGDPANPERVRVDFDISLTPNERLDIAVLNMFHWRDEMQSLMDDPENGLDYFDLAEAIGRAEGEDAQP